MDKARIADNKPAKVYLTKGQQYHFCTCGKSHSQPSCDGSHEGTSFLPKVIVAEKDGNNNLCTCKQSGNLPFCDGTHVRIDDLKIGSLGSGPSIKPTEMPEVITTKEEPKISTVYDLAHDGLEKMGHHGVMGAMGVPSYSLPKWDDIQLMVAQLHTQPLLETVPVSTELIIGPNARKPLKLSMPIFVSDMSFGALSEEAKIALATGAEQAGTGICSGEGGMLPEEQAANSHYFYELASAMFGYSEDVLPKVQTFHFKGGQGAKTGTGGHLPADKNCGKISKIRGIPEGEPAISPPTFENIHTLKDFITFSDRVREVTGGIPIGFKISANHIEEDVRFAVDAGADYIILDGRGGGTGDAPLIFRDHISVPTIPALARARRCLDSLGVSGKITLIITGGLRMPIDFVKALALGADGIAISSSALQAIGCVGARICNSNNCPAGIATQKPELRAKLNVPTAANQLTSFLNSSVELMSVMARACGHDSLAKFSDYDLSTWSKEMSELSGIWYSGVHKNKY